MTEHLTIGALERHPRVRAVRIAPIQRTTRPRGPWDGVAIAWQDDEVQTLGWRLRGARL